MRCPFCGSDETQVKDSRPAEDGASVRRRRECSACGGRFTTFERVQLRELMVVKNTGKRAPFDRDKLMRSILIALRKREFEPERVEQMVSGIVRRLEASGENEIETTKVGELVMEGLAKLDDVAYVRYASVYKNFREAKDFEQFLGKMDESEQE
ncbi:transcriptional regulator NrdR [Hyphococcus sp. DH-69]|uniref:transcriptional regulator NrdR n=1 Tax=Hyphococcus formosus TaxID=3143534 RepID=UPI00398B5FA5